MSKFRKKPVEIQAMRVLEIQELAIQSNAAETLPKWIVDAYDAGQLVFQPHYIVVKTLEGDMKAYETDWLIQGVKGELYPCKPDIFEATYEAVND